MDLIVFNDPAGLPWQTNLCDLMLLAMFLAAVAVAMLRGAQPPVPVERFTIGLVFVYLAGCAPMVIGNVAHERTLMQYMVVQGAGLIVMGALVLYPLRFTRGDDAAPAQRLVVAASGPSGK